MNKILAVLCLVLCASCSAQHSPIMNVTNISEVDFANVDSFKEGIACGKWYFGIGPFGYPTLVDAIKNGQITKVTLVDNYFESSLFTRSECVKVYGE